MFDFLKRKSLIVFILTGTIIFLLATFFIFSKDSSPDHCFNNVQDKGEEGIDCGGPCQKSCDLLEDLEILWTKILPSGEENYHFVALVKNPNSLYGISQFRYQFIGLDEENNPILTRAGESFILPKEEKYLFEMDIDEKVSQIKKVDFKIADKVWERFSFYKRPVLVVINQGIENVQDNVFSLKVQGRLINDSVYNLRTVIIKVVLFNNQNEPVAINKTYLGDIRAREKRDFKVFWKKAIDANDVSKVEIKPETNIFKDENFIKDYYFERVTPHTLR